MIQLVAAALLAVLISVSSAQSEPSMTQAVTFQSAASANGNGTLVSIGGYNSVSMIANNTGLTGTLNYEATNDGTNFTIVMCRRVDTDARAATIALTTATSVIGIQCNVAGFNQFRVRLSGVSAGSTTISGFLSDNYQP